MTKFKTRLDLLPEFEPKITRGYFGRYTQMVTSANTGAILKFPGKQEVKKETI